MTTDTQSADMYDDHMTRQTRSQFGYHFFAKQDTNAPKLWHDFSADIGAIPDSMIYGMVSKIRGVLVEIQGLSGLLSIGDHCRIIPKSNDITAVLCEVISMEDDKALALSFGSLEGVGTGCKIEAVRGRPLLYPSMNWLGRVVDGFGDPIDHIGPIDNGLVPYLIKANPLPASHRRTVGDRLDVGVRALNTFVPICRGQRLGIFSGSGVGKTVLMSMISRHCEADVIVVGLIGERGREVNDFLRKQLPIHLRHKAVVVVATSDEPAVMRRTAAQTTLTIAEYFRDHGLEVLCLMDSVTRVAMAQREIGLAIGEPPTTKSYTPSVFSEMPRLLERAGPGLDEYIDLNNQVATTPQGNITAFFTILVEGDDYNEPISDMVRGILDGHIILDRAIANRNRYPAINVLESLSRMLPDCHNEEENILIAQSYKILSSYNDMEELIRIGAYQSGSNIDVDNAIFYYPFLEEFLEQNKDKQSDFASGFAQLKEIFQKMPPHMEKFDANGDNSVAPNS